MVMKLLLLLAILCQCRGQIIHDSGQFLLTDNSLSLNAGATSRKICYDGTDIYYTQGTQILRVGTPTSVIVTAPSDIDSLSCCEDGLAYTYQTSTSGNMSHVLFCNINDVSICFIKSYSNDGPLAVTIDKVIDKLIVVSQSSLWLFNFDFDGSDIQLDLSPNLSFPPACVAAYENTADTVCYFFVSHPGQTQVSLITYNKGANTMGGANTVGVGSFNVQNSLGNNAIVSCLDISGDRIYFLIDSTSTSSSEIDIYDVGDWLSLPHPAHSASTIVSGSQIAGDIPDNVNGLVVCTTTTCPAPPSSSCTATQCTSPCGFCTNLAPTDCVCANSNDQCCQYTNPTVEDMCDVPIVQADACCVINNPLAQRRRPGDINIFAAAGEAATFEFNRRTSPVGRFSINALPMGTQTNGNAVNVWWRRYQIPTPGSLRGKRFGVFLAEVDPSGTSESQNIHCVVTENSGFFNKFYTYTEAAGASNSVTLVASVNSRVSNFVSTMRWQFRPIDQSTNMPTGSPTGIACSGLMCTIGNPLEKTDEGIYEVFRPRREKRLWHPIFFLYVRECPRTEYMSGTGCTACSSTCVHGDCVENQCICYPGWTGADCNNVTALGFVGQNGDIPCSTFNFDNSSPIECRDLLFCYANKVGCRCSTGLKPPKCWFDCDAGSWGPNCINSCAGSTCNRRDGP